MKKVLNYLLILTLTIPVLADTTVQETSKVEQVKQESFWHKPSVKWGGAAVAGALTMAAFGKLASIHKHSIPDRYSDCYQNEKYAGAELLYARDRKLWAWFWAENTGRYGLEAVAIGHGIFAIYALGRSIYSLLPEKKQKTEQEKSEKKLTQENKAIIKKAITFVMHYCGGNVIKALTS
jgi:hypothetical protein